MDKIKNIVNYVICGILTTILNILVFYILDIYNVNYRINTTISTLISVIFAYITNKIYVFESRELGRKKVLKEILKFIFSRVGTYIVEIIGMYIFIELVKIENLISKILMNVIVIILNYILSKFYIFKKEEVKK